MGTGLEINVERGSPCLLSLLTTPRALNQLRTAYGGRFVGSRAEFPSDRNPSCLVQKCSGRKRVAKNGCPTAQCGQQTVHKLPLTAAPIICLPQTSLQKNYQTLCAGTHVRYTSKVKAFKLLSIAGAYHRGDEKNKQLQRIYGTAFPTREELARYLEQMEQAKLRDHRKLGRDLRLFVIDDDVGQGLVLWTPNGSVIRQELQTFISEELRKQGYAQVFTPHIGKLELYKMSGHFPFYKESQFTPLIENESLARVLHEGCSCAEMMVRLEALSARLASQINARTGRETITPDRIKPDEHLLDGFLLKPMNCPHHIKIFASQPHSYRDLPVRLAEFGTVYRWEQSGELNGMTRVRGFTQDDAHLFCTEEQVAQEVLGCLALVKIVLTTLGMSDYRVRVGLRDPDSNKYIGQKENWDKAESACREAAKTLGVAFTEEPGEAAFYGPKIDFVVKDVIGREWQLGTVQVDYNLPVRFDLTYSGADNKAHRPVMIHRAPFGSMERFCGVLIEHFGGDFPVWLSPEQVQCFWRRSDFDSLGARRERRGRQFDEEFLCRIVVSMVANIDLGLGTDVSESRAVSRMWLAHGRRYARRAPGLRLCLGP